MTQPLRGGRLWSLTVLLLLSAPPVWCQAGSKNLSFEKLDSNGVPEGWDVYDLQLKDSRWGGLRRDGCRVSANCLYVSISMRRYLPAAEFARRAVRVTGWMKSVQPGAYERADIDLFS